MNENIKWFAAAVGVVGLSVGAVIYLSMKDKAPPPTEPPLAVTPPPAAVPEEEPAVKHPLPTPANQEALPALADSDQPMQNAIGDLIGKETVEKYFVPENLVRHLVVSIDNLSESKVAERIRPLKRVPGSFEVDGADQTLVLDPRNYERYKPLVQTIKAVDSKVLIATYVRYYPLFQDAYESLGHPPEYFNDRLIEIIDLLLATPDVRSPIPLAQPGVLYEYADPKLEALSAGQKALIRMGSDNAAAVKDKLRELRVELVAQKPAD